MNAVRSDSSGNSTVATERMIVSRDKTRATLASFSREIDHTVSGAGAEQRNSSLQQHYIAMVTHDLRTPLTNVRGFLELISMGVYKDNPKLLREQARQAERNIDRLMRLIGDLLCAEKLLDGRLSLNASWIDAHDLAHNSLEQFKYVAKRTGIHMSSQVSIDRIFADHDRLMQVLINLLSNSIVATPQNGEICLNIHKTDEHFVLEVIDSGIGIPSTMLSKIFERFEQSDYGRNESGFGLGLAISKALVEAHGGTILVSSVPDVGSKFEVKLPVQGL